MVILFWLMTSTMAVADLEWITGGVPKNTADKTGSALVRDAPLEDTHPASGSDQEVIVSHLITSTNIVNQYPIDSVNYFYLNKHKQICYFAYFMMKPSSRIHTATVDWYSPSNLRVAKYTQEFRVGFTDRLLTLQNETYQWFLLEMTIGMDRMRSEYGQIGLPKDMGLYTIHLAVDGQLVGITFFYVKAEAPKPASAVATVAPATNPSVMPMNTPFSKMPIPKNIPSGFASPQ